MWRLPSGGLHKKDSIIRGGDLGGKKKGRAKEFSARGWKSWTTGDSPQGANTSDADPWPRAAPAGATKQGVNGLYDMGANVWEWTTDSPDSKGRERRTVGGSWWYRASNMRADVQAFKPADFYAVYIGFRCVYER